MEPIMKYISIYESWVARNPDIVSDLETTTKWVSYFLGGNSNLGSELTYAASNLLAFYNDRIIDKARTAITDEFTTAKNAICYRVKVMLTTLEYSEVFIELSAKRIFGRRGKWLIICLVQFTKALGRLYLLHNSTIGIISTPPIPALNRRKLLRERKTNGGVLPKATCRVTKHIQLAPESQTSYQLKRSGRIMRKVEGAPPMQYRDFKLQSEHAETSNKGSELSKDFLHAEYIYIAKPLIHLAAMGLFGERNWQQFVTALATDLISLRMHHNKRDLLTAKQRQELSRRTLALAIYLARSPLYDSFSKSRVETLLNVAENIPLARLVVKPLREYIPHWQRMYFYLWSS